MLAQCLDVLLELLNIAFDLLLPLLHVGHMSDQLFFLGVVVRDQALLLVLPRRHMVRRALRTL